LTYSHSFRFDLRFPLPARRKSSVVPASLPKPQEQKASFTERTAPTFTLTLETGQEGGIDLWKVEGRPSGEALSGW